MQISHWLAGLRTSRGATGRTKRRVRSPSAPACIDLLESRTLLSAMPVGPDDFRISHMGPDLDQDFVAQYPAVAYNSLANEYLVVWSGSDVPGGVEIYGQRIDAATGELLGAEIRISDMEPDGLQGPAALAPAVVFNPTANEYLVVWQGDDGGETGVEIYGQRLSADGTEVGANDFRISDAGPEGHQYSHAGSPDLVYNSVADEYLVVWNSSGGPGEQGIYGQRLSADGTEVGTNDFQISQLSVDGVDGASFVSALHPSIAFNAADNEYLVAWWGNFSNWFRSVRSEIYGQRLSADGTEIGQDDFQISSGGGRMPDLVFNPSANEYFLSWSYGPEVFGRRVNVDGTAVGEASFQISEETADGFVNSVAVTYNGRADEYLVVWHWDGGALEERDILGQRLRGDGDEVLGNFLISDRTPVGEQPALAYSSADNEYLVVWRGIAPGSELEFEIYGQRLASSGTPRKYIATGADAGGGPHVKVFDAATGDLVFSFFAYDPAFRGGVRVAVADVNGDGIDDIITAAGHGGGPHVKIFDGHTGELVREFMAYDGAFTGGVHVAAGDFDGDGRADVVTGADAGGGPHVRIYSGATGELIAERFAYVAEFAGGVRLAVGDVNGDGHDDLITAAGPGGGPHVKVFDGTDLLGEPLLEFFAGSADFSGGIYIAAADLDRNGNADIITGQGSGGESQLTVWSIGTVLEIGRTFEYIQGRRTFVPFPGLTGGVRVGAADVNRDGWLDIVAAAGPGGEPRVTVFDGMFQPVVDGPAPPPQLRSFLAYIPEFTGGVFVAGSPDPGPQLSVGARFGVSSNLPDFELTDNSLDALFDEDDLLDPLSVPAALGV